jgi:hypothetical protein
MTMCVLARQAFVGRMLDEFLSQKDYHIQYQRSLRRLGGAGLRGSARFPRVAAGVEAVMSCRDRQRRAELARFDSSSFRPIRSSVDRSRFLNCDPLDLIKRDLISGAIVELGGARAFVRSHELGVVGAYYEAHRFRSSRQPRSPPRNRRG